MQRGPSQRQRANSKSMNNNNKKQQHNSKNKRLIQNKEILANGIKNSTPVTSPLIIKELNYDKQNVDVLQSVLKIISAAAEPKQKQILLSIASQIEKQKKIRTYLSQKQTASDISELQVMLTHLKQEQLKQISSLKIEIGKRKLQNLDEHDLREDILNLNSYVMRRTKKQAIVAKNSGVDVIGEIYSKFDQQSKIISQVWNTERVNIRNNVIKQKQKDHSNLQQLNNKTKQNENKSSQVSPTSSQSELMMKILKLQKQNLRLIKQISKIEQQFECVVEEKLLLEDRIEKCKTVGVSEKDDVVKCLKQLRDILVNEGCYLQLNKEQINTFFGNLHKKIMQQLKKYQPGLRDSINEQQSYEINNMESPIFYKTDQSSSEQVSNAHGSNQIRVNEQQNALIQKYENILTQKQIQINKYLKVISRMKEQGVNADIEKEQIRKQGQKNRLMVEKCKKCIRDLQYELKQIKFQLYVIVQIMKQKFMEYNQFFILQFEHELRDQMERNKQLQDIICGRQKQTNILSSQIVRVRQQNAKMNLEIEEMKNKIEQQRINNEKQKQRLISQIQNIEDILKNQKQIIRVQKQQKGSLIQSEIMALRSSQMSKLQQIAYLTQRNKQKQKQIQIIKQRNIEKSQIILRLEQRGVAYEIEIQRLKNQLEDTRNSLIEECGMLLQQKIEQINLTQLKVERQKLINQDLTSYLRQEQLKKANLNHARLKQFNKIKQSVSLLKKQLTSIAHIQAQFCQFIILSMSQYVGQFQSNTRSVEHLENKNVKLLQIYSNSVDLCIERTKQEPNYEKFIHQISFVIKQWMEKKFPPQQEINQQLINQQRLISIKNGIVNIVKQASIYRQERDILDNCKKNSNFQKNYENLMANSPQQNDSQPRKVQSSSFLNELKPFIFYQNQISLSDIINQSGFIQQVEALRKQLEGSFKRIQVLEGELKIYQQKDIDKIFDF